MSTIRCRIAPSPSGFLHIGTAKMALFNWLFARSQGGTFLLRLEDTDAERTDEQYVQAMCEGFQWLGIDWDEGPPFGDVSEKGGHGPYRQSQRKQLHQDAALKLVAEGKAYKCFTPPEEIEAWRNKLREEKRSEPFRSVWRDADAGAIAAKGDAPFVVRFKVTEGETVVEDMVQGTVRTKNYEFDDFVILKPNSDPIFHLSVVVDDATMGITHVIRGDDHLTNCARHVMLFHALGYALPKFAHLPMVLDEKGKKFSKREHGANVLDWREDGYLPEALINYVALLGWTPEEENRELFTREELKEHFTIDRWGKSAARFDRKKLDWLNGQHIRMLSPETLRDRFVPILQKAGFDTDAKTPEWLCSLAEICQEKLATLNDIIKQADFFFLDISEYEEKNVKKLWLQDDALERLKSLQETLAGVAEWQRAPLHDTIKSLAESREEGMGKWVGPLRLALTGKSVGPGLFELAELLGREECMLRLKNACEYVESLDTYE